MMAKPKSVQDECNHIKRTFPEHNLDEELANEIIRNARTLPVFELGLLERILTQHYSLERNELLSCRWKVYKKNIETRKFSPFQFPLAKHLHFYKGIICYQPSETIGNRGDYRMKLRSGPGVDVVGQIPIPQELFLKRGIISKESKYDHKGKRIRSQ